VHPSTSRRRGGRARQALPLIAACIVALSLAACSSTTKASSTTNPSTGSAVPSATVDVDQATVDATIKKAFLGDVPASSLDPVVLKTLTIASVPLTSEQQTLLNTCMTQRSCETGNEPGNLTLGINADFTNNPYWNIRRAEAIAQAIATPEIGKVIFTSAPDGNISQVLANLKSLIAQRVDIIVEDPVFGAAVLPAAQQAVNAGIAFVTANSPLPESATSAVTAQIPFPLCDAGTNAVKAISGSIGNDKSYALYTGVPGNAYQATWWPCAKAAIGAANSNEALEGFTQWTAQGTAAAANALIASGKHVDALMSDDYIDLFIKPFIDEGKNPPVTFSNTAHYSTFAMLKEAKDKGLSAESYAANGHVWFVRMAVTAGVAAKLGQSVPKVIKVPVPVTSMADLTYLDEPGMPANAPVPTLLTVQQAQAAISANE